MKNAKLLTETFPLFVAVVLIGMGERMAERFLPIYLLALGGGTLAVGLLGGFNNLLAAIYSWIGGEISDRIGTKQSLLLFNAISIAGYLLVLLVPVWQAALLGAVLYLSWSAISLPATMSFFAERLPKNRHVLGVSLHSLVRRVPMALGPVAGGALIAAFGEIDGVRAAFVAALAMAAASLAIQHRCIADSPPRERAPKAGALWRGMNAPLKRLLASDILIRFCEQIPNAFVVVWCMKEIPVPISAVEFGLLTAIEMLTAVTIYLPVARLADRSEKKIFVLITFGFFTLFPLVLLLSRTIEWLVVAFIVRGLKEFGEPTRKALIMHLAPRGREAATFGFYYLVRDTIVSLAAFAGAWLWSADPQWNLLAAAACGVFGTAWFALSANDPQEKGRATTH